MTGVFNLGQFEYGQRGFRTFLQTQNVNAQHKLRPVDYTDSLLVRIGHALSRFRQQNFREVSCDVMYMKWIKVKDRCDALRGGDVTELRFHVQLLDDSVELSSSESFLDFFFCVPSIISSSSHPWASFGFVTHAKNVTPHAQRRAMKTIVTTKLVRASAESVSSESEAWGATDGFAEGATDKQHKLESDALQKISSQWAFGSTDMPDGQV